MTLPLIHRLHEVVGEHRLDPTGLTLFYIGLAIAARNPARGRALLQQIEREFAASQGRTPEVLEVSLRSAADDVYAVLARALTEDPA